MYVIWWFILHTIIVTHLFYCILLHQPSKARTKIYLCEVEMFSVSVLCTVQRTSAPHNMYSKIIIWGYEWLCTKHNSFTTYWHTFSFHSSVFCLSLDSMCLCVKWIFSVESYRLLIVAVYALLSLCMGVWVRAPFCLFCMCLGTFSLLCFSTLEYRASIS